MNSERRINELVEANVKLANFLASKATDIDSDEALSLALEGLHVAATEFDEGRGIPFGAFAGQRIKWAIGAHRTYLRAKKRGGGTTTVSLNDLLGENSEIERGDLVADTNADTFAPLAALGDLGFAKRLLRRLDRRSATVLSLRFGLYGGEPQTLEQVGEHFGLTRERIRQIEALALGKLLPLAKEAPRDRQKKLTDAWKARHPEKIREYRSKWALNNPAYPKRYRRLNAAKIRAQRKGYRTRNRALIKAAHANEYLRNKALYSERARKHYQANREEIKRRVRAWIAENREKNKHTKKLYREANRTVLADKELARYHNYYRFREQYRANRARYRTANRLIQRAWSRARSAALTDGYVREQLSKNTGISSKDWSAEDVVRKRKQIADSRECRVSNEGVLEIRNTFIKGKSELSEFAERFRCSRSTIYNLVHYKTRANIKMAEAA